ncbi:hypothetical protein SRABI106_01881 [Rahnella aquatilis]|nr:hypothetical protein SRABI106_01881 [Rahnella aquatilis]
MRCLDQRQTRVFQEAADRRLQERAGGHVVTVEYANQLAFGEFHCMVQVAGFGMGVVVTGDISHAGVSGEHRKFVPFTVIQNINFDFIFRIIDALRRQHGVTYYVETFVIRRNIHIDGWPQRGVIRQRFDGAF